VAQELRQGWRVGNRDVTDPLSCDGCGQHAGEERTEKGQGQAPIAVPHKLQRVCHIRGDSRSQTACCQKAGDDEKHLYRHSAVLIEPVDAVTHQRIGDIRHWSVKGQVMQNNQLRSHCLECINQGHAA